MRGYARIIFICRICDAVADIGEQQDLHRLRKGDGG